MRAAMISRSLIWNSPKDSNCTDNELGLSQISTDVRPGTS